MLALAGAIAALVPIAGGILAYLIRIERSLATVAATVIDQGKAIEDLKNFRLNVEQARALGRSYGRRADRR